MTQPLPLSDTEFLTDAECADLFDALASKYSQFGRAALEDVADEIRHDASLPLHNCDYHADCVLEDRAIARSAWGMG